VRISELAGHVQATRGLDRSHYDAPTVGATKTMVKDAESIAGKTAAMVFDADRMFSVTPTTAFANQTIESDASAPVATLPTMVFVTQTMVFGIKTIANDIKTNDSVDKTVVVVIQSDVSNAN